MKQALAEVVALITRPEGQSAGIAELIRAAGGKPILFPAMGIEPLPGTDQAPALNELREFSLVVFVSPNAAREALPHILQHGGLSDWVKIAAVGPGTAAELIKSGMRNIITPRQGFDSEALIQELSGMPPSGSRALIVRGRGGRELLGDTLRSRGVKVEYLECYRRVVPNRSLDDLPPAWRGSNMRACVATSSAIVTNLFAMAGDSERARLTGVPFFVSHPRVAATAFSHAVQCIFVAGLGDEALVSGMKTWFAREGAAQIAR